MDNRHLQSLEKELLWLDSVLKVRFALYFQEECAYVSVKEIEPPYLQDISPYGQLIEQFDFGFEERLAIILTIASQLRPQILDIFFTKNQLYDKNFTEFGGIRNEKSHIFFPTLQTLAFILGENSLDARLKVLKILDKENNLRKFNILYLDSKDSDFFMGSILKISTEYWHLLVLNQLYEPSLEDGFPAQHLKTHLDWDDLVVSPEVLDEISELSLWIKHSQTLLKEWQLEKRVAKGYRALFYGSAGTGKTLTASLLGKANKMQVYRIDLSLIVSKYIGETEKNLSKVFDLAENKNWILFFDEADALFGKRTQTKDAHDRYANQEVSYLLQRIENFDGIIILATNLKANLDEAFTRRFQSIIYFPVPDAQLRFKLWKNIFKGNFGIENIDFKKIAQDHEISGGEMTNVLRYAALQAISKNKRVIDSQDVEEGIRREVRKGGKTS